MPTTQTAAELRQRCLDTMGPELGPIYCRLYNECVWLHTKWAEYVELFDTSPERVELMNRVDPRLFRIIQDALWRDVLLHLSRLTDEPVTSRRKTLTTKRLPSLVHPKIHDEMRAAVDRLSQSVKFARDRRHHHYAHLDLNTALGRGATTLETASRAKVRDALGCLRSTLHVVEWFYLEVTTGYENSHVGTNLLVRLRDGLKAEDDRRDRIRGGHGRPEDWRDEPI